MGSLKNKMPATFLCMLIGGLALMGFPFLSGYYSKDLIIEWAYTKGPGWFWLATGAVVLTAMYTTRLLVVVFMGKPRSEAAKKAHESPMVMVIPLLLLAIPAWMAGYPFIQEHFFNLGAEPEVPHWVHWVILAFLAVGILGTIFVYRGAPEKDPVVIPFFANRLYIDNLYAWIVRWVQDGTAAASGFFDRWIIDVVCVQFSAKVVWAIGFTLRFLQIGNLQAYAFFFGAGVVALIYFLIVAK